MTWKDTAAPVLTRLPAVNRPTGHVAFKDKLKWTAIILVLYFFLTNIQIWGLGAGSSDAFGQFRSILAGSFGSVLTLGIGPIVTASIVLQLLSGAELLNLDTNNDPRDQQIYQGLQKFLVFVMILFTGFPMIFGGGFLPADTSFASVVPGGVLGVQLLMFAQITVGGIFILYMDEVISKWGVGSGVGLFIIAGVSQRLFGGIVGVESIAGQNGIIANWIFIATGDISLGPIFTGSGINSLIFGAGSLLAIATTVLIFVAVVYTESVRVEIPLSNSSVKGARGKFPVKLIYASVLPMILVRAIQANIQFLGNILNAQLGSNMPEWLGVYSSGSPVDGLFYYLAPIYSPQDWMWWLGSTTNETWQILLRAGVDLTIMVVGGGIFAIFWVETTDMGAKATAEQIHNSGMQIPGFRRNTQVIERVLAKYIPVVTVLGGAIVGVLAVMANMLGTIGGVSGTGLLLTVSITYKLYEEIAEEALMDMHPMMRKMFGDS